MRPSANRREIDGVAIFVNGLRSSSISLVVSEAVFDTYDNPVMAIVLVR